MRLATAPDVCGGHRNYRKPPVLVPTYITERMRARQVKKKHGIIIETPTEARQAERGPSVLLLLSVSLILVVLGMAVVWYVFFRT
jgi:hypothetical protein